MDRLLQIEGAEPLDLDPLYFTWNEEIARHKATGHRGGRPTDGPQDNVGLFGAAYGLHTEARNYVRFSIAAMGEDGLRQEGLKEMVSAHIRFPPGHSETVEGQVGWSLGFGIDSTAHGIEYKHGGNNGDFKAYAHFYKHRGYGLVLFCNADHLFCSGFGEKLGEFLYID